jgi:hypothetical protein
MNETRDMSVTGCGWCLLRLLKDEDPWHARAIQLLPSDQTVKELQVARCEFYDH